ncbi:o-succinylbenzoate synthase [Anaerobacillus isosaccharinicus]|uniref:o-succinylbenzoate synthase n=1 Tax=Anaerobacillus isosaccharinicus TaxID=1532552 RepID=A0A1S2LZZ1_9BACI|nr:o-succinylbenzoate synthase [Anaerobacillus isosaccharinicus]MBA5586552.1 o-succinylbenzoate synthase [Anaerobacillus isosaccharinicus]QOY35209.1 o-succinylbenzoate synthase [Anaerobacillus isosaccharinicus]
MEIQSINLSQIKMELLHPFTTSVGTEYDKSFIVVEVLGKSGLSGWGESVSIIEPIYNEETVGTNWHIMSEFLIPMLLKASIKHPDQVSELFTPIRRNYNAKAAIECAIWDLYAKEKNISLAKALGGVKDKIEVGVSVGIQKSAEAMVEQIASYINEGYKRIKVKIKPEWDVHILKLIRKHFPEIQLMADANCAYTLADIPHLQKLDEFDLTMIEQPLASDDIIDHAKLQEKLKTSICLDESIHTSEDARKAIELGSCKIINLKLGRVGGLTETKKIHDLCEAHGIPVWCGGMLEGGIGRAHNIAITSLSNFTIPGDTAPSSHYWKQDIIFPEVVMVDGYIKVPDAPGIGFEPNHDYIEQLTLKQKTFSLN